MLTSASFMTEHGDAVWGALVGIAATIIIGIAIARWQRQPKQLGYRINTDASILSASAYSIGGGLEVRWEGHTLERPGLLEIQVENVGKREVVAEDYNVPITVSLHNSRVVSATIVAARPSNAMDGATVNYESGGNSVQVLPVLLNPSDWFVLRCVTDGRSGGVALSARLRGETGGMRDTSRDRQLYSMREIGLRAGVVIVLGLVGTANVNAGTNLAIFIAVALLSFPLVRELLTQLWQIRR